MLHEITFGHVFPATPATLISGTRKMLETKYRPLADLTLLADNPRQIQDADFKKLCTSIQAHPDYFEARPCILSDRTGELVIIAGNMRYRAAKQLGLAQIPMVLMPALTVEREREIVIRDNVSNGDWSWDDLANGDWPDAATLNEWGVNVPKEWGAEQELPSAKEDYSDKIGAGLLQVVVECLTERDQELLFNKLTEEGYQCKLLTL